jgi:hypothetical protein
LITKESPAYITTIAGLFWCLVDCGCSLYAIKEHKPKDVIMKNIRVNISDSKNNLVSVTVSLRLAETYLKIVYGTANEKPKPSDTIKAVQYLASNGRDNIPVPQSKDELINLMLILIEKQHFGQLN